MRDQLIEALERSNLDYEAVRFARGLIRDPLTVIDREEIKLQKNNFKTIYSVRAEILADLGKATWNFPRLLEDVEAVPGDSVCVSLLNHPYQRILVVRTESGELVGCAAFNP